MTTDAQAYRWTRQPRIQVQPIDSWRTEEELAFVDGLGLHGSRRGQRTRRIALLQRYFASVAVRKDWGNVDPRLVCDHVLWLLRRAGA